jgi:aspartate/methionine/tyrosine aminotransferase
MGVIHVVAEASKRGFFNGNPEWSNLGQGQPEVGPIDGAPERLAELQLDPSDFAYGPVNGLDPLREAVAEHYNRLYRLGRASRYTKDNVAIAQGGRLMLSRVMAVLDAVRVGYLTPDYTAYQDMLEQHQHRITPVAIPLDPARGFRPSLQELERAVLDERLGALVFSNPCNPTGQVLRRVELARLVTLARERNCLTVLDEFYSHYIYGPYPEPVSAAAYVRDVDRDPVLLIDGLTKNYRYPGLRLGWAVGPPDVVEALGRAASSLDGGPCVPLQRAAIKILEPRRADQETAAVRTVFARKRALMVTRLTELGVRFAPDALGTFYLWGRVDALPRPLNDAMTFFWQALERRVMIVPGQYFDINPGSQRPGPSPLGDWVRFSFGPSEANMLQGLDRLAELVADAADGRLEGVHPA